MYKTTGPVLCFCFLVLTVIVKAAQDIKVGIDRTKNLKLTCPIQPATDIMWVREGRVDQQNHRMEILDDGSLFIAKVDKNDSGIYTCSRENVVQSDFKQKFNVTVRSPPPPLIVTIKTSTVIALILWKVNGTGGYPIINFTAQYRLAYANESWIPISPNHITPNSRQIEVYNLQPNTTYEFRIWATNQLGRGDTVNVFNTTLDFYQERELARRLLHGAQDFDTSIWAIAVGIVMGTLILLGIGTCVLLYQECKTPEVQEEQEIIELVPNIILNPGFDGTNQHDQMPDENSNNELPLRLNNNTVVQPRNM